MSETRPAVNYTRRVAGLILLLGLLLAGGFSLLWHGLTGPGRPANGAAPWWMTGALAAMLIVVLAHVWLRLRPLDRLLARDRSGEETFTQAELRRAARSMAIAPVFLLGPFFAGLVVLLWTYLSHVLLGDAFNPTSGAVVSFLIPLLVGGLIASLLIRVLLRPAWRALGFRRLPPVLRFGVVPRMVFSLLLVTQVAVAAGLWIDSRSCGRMLQSGLASPGDLAQLPLAVPVGIALLFLFSAAIGGFLAGGIGRQMTSLARRFEAMGAGELAKSMEPLPVHSSTVAGNIARAFNRLLSVQQRIQKQLGEYADRAARSEQTRARFLRHVSHELRTPLNSVIGFSELLVQGVSGSLNEAQRESARIVNLSGERLLRTINDILLLAQFDADRVDVSRETIDQGKIWQGVLAELQLTGGCRAILDGDGSLLDTRLDVDARLWIRALTALVEVAERQAGDQAIHVEIARGPADGLVWRVQVSEAVGTQLQVGDLVAGGQVGLRGNLSLGIGLSRRIAHLHGGEVQVGEEDGRWEIALRLPKAASGASA